VSEVSVLRGNPSPEEVAALLAALATRTRPAPAAQPPTAAPWRATRAATGWAAGARSFRQ